MHPLLIALPILALVFGPRWWAGRLLRHYDREEQDLPYGSAELARRLLDDKGLTQVDVQVTDLSDHYDPVAKAVRICRDRYDRRTLTAVTTAAHEVGHALQDIEGYWPFRLRGHLARVARVTGQTGGVLLLAVPVAALGGRNPLPPLVVAGAATAMLATSLAAQLAALPSELDASFARALPMLEDCCLEDGKVQQARRILLACSLTYVASSVTSLLTLWPWLGRAPGPVMPRPAVGAINIGLRAEADRRMLPAWPRPSTRSVPSDPGPAGLLLPPLTGQSAPSARPSQRIAQVRLRQDPALRLLRPVLRPLISGWLRAPSWG
jgi:Zn-dependent membrane protease YugP